MLEWLVLVYGNNLHSYHRGISTTTIASFIAFGYSILKKELLKM